MQSNDSIPDYFVLARLDLVLYERKSSYGRVSVVTEEARVCAASEIRRNEIRNNRLHILKMVKAEESEVRNLR